MFLSMQSLNGDSYQGAQVGANVQSQVGPPTRDGSWYRSAEGCPCLACVLDSNIHSAVSSTKKSDLQLNVLLWVERFACQNASHPTAQARLLAQIPNISTYVNAFGFDLNSWVGIRGLFFWGGVCFSPLFPVFRYCCLILLLCLVVFHFISCVT